MLHGPEVLQVKEKWIFYSSLPTGQAAYVEEDPVIQSKALKQLLNGP